MRATIVALLLAACTTTMHFRVIEKGSYGPAEGRAPSIVVQGSVVTLNVGKRPTGGWSIEPLEVSGDEQLLTIKTKVNRPSTGGIVTEAFTSAYVKLDVGVQPKAVRWVDEDGQLMAETK